MSCFASCSIAEVKRGPPLSIVMVALALTLLRVKDELESRAETEELQTVLSSASRKRLLPSCMSSREYLLSCNYWVFD
jgi:hypothetical protein